ncbi:MAG: DUF4920 domain-containing protein [Bacteroidetes bacterium]|nr:DUF4920 domain-containing protein [Bacteroidota bacterium]
MKQFILLLCLVAGTSLVAQDAQYFGEKISEKGAISGADFAKKIEGQDSLRTKIKVHINEACQKKGCWMNVDLGNGQEMMVRFKDYGFFVPKDCGGSEAIIEGVASRETLSVETLRHYAEDAGKSKEEIMAITEPQSTLSFEADGVIIYPVK